MLTFEEIIDSAKLCSEEDLSMPTLKLIEQENYSPCGSPSTLQGCNNIYTLYGLPLLPKNQNPTDLLSTIRILSDEYKKQGIVLSPELDELCEANDRVTKYKQLERECDMAEVDLARKTSRLENLSKYCKYTSAELNYKLEALTVAEKFSLLENEFNVRIKDFVSSGKQDDGVLHLLSSLRNTPEYLAWETASSLKEGIEQVPDTPQKTILVTLCFQGPTTVKHFVNSLNLERVELLKVVYELVANKLIKIDRYKDILEICTTADEQCN